MKNKITFTLMALGLALPVANLQAQDDSRPQRGPRGERPAFIGALDANKDAVIDKSELSAAADSLKKLDTDNDGKLSMPELRGAQGRGPRSRDGGEGDQPAQRRGPRAEGEERAGQRPEGERPRPAGGPPLIAALDTNKNGMIDADELTAAPAALLKLDKNSDGQLTMDEIQAGRGPRGGRPDGERPARKGGPEGKEKPEGDKATTE